MLGETMEHLLTSPDFWNSIARMLWPIAVIVIFFSLRSSLLGFFQRDSVSFEVAGIKLSAANVAENFSKEIGDLQNKLIALEELVNSGDVSVRRSQTADSIASLTDGDVSPRAPSSKISILWVDDYPQNNAFLIERFGNDGIEVVLANSTREGLESFNVNRPNLVITDLGRREDGKSYPFAGLDLIRKIRAMDPAVPIAVFAGQRGIENRDKLTAAGAGIVTQSPLELQSYVAKLRS
jgi:CheY-like chemotaxis protein